MLGEEEGERTWFIVVVSESLAHSGEGVSVCSAQGLREQALNGYVLSE